MTETSSPVLSIVGAGSMGQTFAAMLAASGQPVTLLSTAGSAARLMEARAIRIRGGLSLDVPVAPAPAPQGSVGVTTDPATLPAGAGLLFTTKGHQLADAIASVQGVWPRSGDDAAWVAGLQNGLLKDEQLAEAFGAGRVVGSATITSAQREITGEILFIGKGITYLGEIGAPPSPRVLAAAEALRRAGLPADAAGDVRSVLWSKACNAAGVFGVCTLTRRAGPGMLATEGAARAYIALVKETAAIGRAYGVETGDFASFPPIRTYVDRPTGETVAQFVRQAAAAPNAAAATRTYPSMLQDLLAGRPLEVDEIFGDLVRRARDAGVPAPRLEIVCDLISGLNPVPPA